MPKTSAILPAEGIESHILLIHGHKVMLSPHLAPLYGVERRALVQAVKRNRERFPKDFMFQLSAREFANLKSQTVISSWGGGFLLCETPLLKIGQPFPFPEREKLGNGRTQCCVSAYQRGVSRPAVNPDSLHCFRPFPLCAKGMCFGTGLMAPVAT